MSGKAHEGVSIGAIVLAAGRSARMGIATNKLLEVVAGRPLVAWPIDAMLEAALEPVVVVAGFEASRLREALADRLCIVVEHAGWPEGMGSTLAAGIRFLQAHAPELDAVVVSVGDLPGLRARHVAAVVAAAKALGPLGDAAAPGANAPSVRERIGVPTCRGRAGHPVLFGRRCWDELARLSGDQGGRAIVEDHPERVVRVAIDDDAILADIDTPDALAQVRRGRVDGGSGGDPTE